jgi:hypothetical protein
MKITIKKTLSLYEILKSAFCSIAGYLKGLIICKNVCLILEKLLITVLHS